MTPGDVTTVDDLHSDVLIRILHKLDGPALATLCCATSRVRSLATEPQLWKHLCLSMWPSLSNPRLLDLIPSLSTSNHRNFFSQIYPFPVLPIGNNDNIHNRDSYFENSIISAVDIHHKHDLVFSNVVETDTRSQWFLSSPFRIDALDQKDRTQSTARILSLEDLTLSWIIIDSITHRAVNLSSRRPVSFDRNWYTGEIQVRFAVVLGDHVGSIVVTCGGEEMHLLEVKLTVDDDDGICLNGKDSLVVLHGIMDGERKGDWKKEGGGFKVKERYWEYERKKKMKKEKKARREWTVDLFLVLAGILLFFGFLVRMVLR